MSKESTSITKMSLKEISLSCGINSVFDFVPQEVKKPIKISIVVSLIFGGLAYSNYFVLSLLISSISLGMSVREYAMNSWSSLVPPINSMSPSGV